MKGSEVSEQSSGELRNLSQSEIWLFLQAKMADSEVDSEGTSDGKLLERRTPN